MSCWLIRFEEMECINDAEKSKCELHFEREKNNIFLRVVDAVTDRDEESNECDYIETRSVRTTHEQRDQQRFCESWQSTKQ